ncbi:MAG: hypothetical protein OXC62_12170 [Aestuariivita sp.]|nr:hypothetical protein [Aestuariivita sp.]
MSTEYLGYLQMGNNLIPAGYLNVKEGYNAGWSAEILFAIRSTTDDGSSDPTLAQALGTALVTEEVVPGDPCVVRIAVHSDAKSEESRWVKSWPGYVSSVEPYVSKEASGTFCRVIVLDVINYLGGERLWGAYRGQSAAEIVGGVLSLAAGTEGRATVNPMVPGHAKITINSMLRSSLDFIPYAIAAGQRLSEWLDEFFGLLGIRMEMLAESDGSLTVLLADNAHADNALTMKEIAADADTVPEPDDGSSDGDAPHGQLIVTAIGTYRGLGRRAVLLDDPTKGNFRKVQNQDDYSSAVGVVVSGPHISLDEAATRANLEIRGRGAEMLVVTAASRQPALRPGRTIALSSAVMGVKNWQVSFVEHELSGIQYSNSADLMNADHAWSPRRPSPRPSVTVSASVDAGPSFTANQPVPRDSLGYIHVRFPFSPTISWSDQSARLFDANLDNRVTKDDFAYLIRPDADGEADEDAWHAITADELADRMVKAGQDDSDLSDEHRSEAAALADTSAREQDVIDLYDDKFADPYPDRDNDDLSEEELADRTRLADKRLMTYRYLAWKRALAFEEFGGDSDHDGFVTSIDSAMSDELRAAFADPAQLAKIKAAAEQSQRDEDNAEESDIGSDSQPENIADDSAPQQELVEEYLTLFGDAADPSLTEMATLQRAAADEQWPARVPLQIVQPMAGGLHGFVTAHRQGDICRVAVHTVLHAEITGFQYRSDRDIKDDILSATAGIVAEHNLQSSWSGMVFRQIKDTETPSEESAS